MGIFSAISEGRFAAKMVKIVATKLDVHPYQLPQWLLDSAQNNASAYKAGGYTPETAARLVLDQMSKQILQDMES